MGREHWDDAMSASLITILDAFPHGGGTVLDAFPHGCDTVRDAGDIADRGDRHEKNLPLLKCAQKVPANIFPSMLAT